MKILPDHVLKMVDPKDRACLGKAGILATEAAEKQRLRIERDLQNEIVQYLQMREIVVLWHRTDKKSRATVGWPDLTFCKDGVPWGIEVKTAAGRVRPEQYETMRKMGLNGWQVAIVRSFEEFHDKVFKGHD